MIRRDPRFWVFIGAGGAALWLSLAAYESMSRLRPESKAVVVITLFVFLFVLFFWAYRRLQHRTLLLGIIFMALGAQISLHPPHDVEALSVDGIQLRMESFVLTVLSLGILLLIAGGTGYAMEKLGIISHRIVPNSKARGSQRFQT